jgi:nuclear pore complex protein Nup107
MFTGNLSYSQQGIVTPEGELIDGFLAAVCNDATDFAALDQIAELEELLSLNILSTKHDARESPFEMSALKQERNTWRLVGRLYHDGLMQGESLDNSNSLANMIMSSEKEIIENAFTTDQKLRRAQVIVDWLEYNTRKDLEDYQIKVPAPSTTGWENTLASMLGKIDSRSDTVTSMDPDAALRQKRCLQDLDTQDEHEFAKLLYVYIRAGMLESAQEVSEQSGHPWRAVTLDGWKLFHDSNLGSNVGAGSVEIKPTEGNLNRDLWKRVALRMTQDANMHRYVRAAYSALCGNIQVLKSVCNTWDDLLWAHTKCLVDISVEQRIRETLTTRPMCELPAFYWENKRTIEAVFDSVNATNLSEDNLKEAKMFHEVQRLLILDDVPNLLSVVDQWAGTATLNERDILRFFAHLVIMLKRLDQSSSSYGGQGLLCVRRYCEYLMESNHIQQVAWYVSQLQYKDQIDLYSQFLETLSHVADKRLSLSLAVENALPIHEILSEVVIRIHGLESSDDEEVDASLTQRKIDAIEWLLYDPKQMDEAVERTNLLIRKLKATSKDESARAAFEKIPDSAPDTIMKHCAGEDEQLLASQCLVVKEHLCWSAYFSAKAAFDRWFDYYYKEKPQVPLSKQSQHLTKQVTLEKQTMQYNINFEQWKSTQESLAKEACDKFMAVVTFSGGWLAEPEDDIELVYLRKLCVPELIILLHTVLHTTKNYAQAVALADIVASEAHGLYECFHRENMRIFLNKVKQSAISQLDQQHVN